jgi:thiol-disulfide isomerase/thioredoxin
MAQLLSKTARTFRFSIPQRRAFSLFPSANNRSHTNRLFDNVRQPQDIHTLTLLNAADNRSLITFWSASWCQTCQAVKPLVKQLIEEERVGESEGGLGFVEVEMDSTLIGDLPITYRITSMPTLLAFSRQEAQFDTRLVRPEEMKNKDFLREWLLKEARRGGRQGGGGGGGLFGW